MAELTKLQEVNWKNELKDLVAAAKTPEDKVATEAFAKAIGPYLDNPQLLRTLISKIAQAPERDEVAIVVAQKQFTSLEELKTKLPQNVNVVGLL